MTVDLKKHILIIEDSADLQVLMARLFKKVGYQVSQAYNGRHALDLLASIPELPSLILLDVMMPVMDGIEFRKEQQKDPRLANIPVVMMTADADPIGKAAQLGVDHYFVKPLRDVNKLLQLADTLSA